AYKGQVAGAFYKEGLGDIDLVWGNEKIGLQKIVEKHLNDFADFAGNNPYKKMSNAINEIVENGKLLTENGVNTLWYKNGDDYYLVGISKGFNKQGDNNWIITSYKKDNITNLQKEKVDKLLSSDAEVLSAQGKFNELETLNSTTNAIIPQPPQFKDKTDLEKFYKAKARALENELINNPISKEEALNKIKNHSKETDEAYENFHKTLGLEVEGYPMSMYVNSSVIPYLKEPIVYNTKPKTAHEIKREYQANARIAKAEQSRQIYKQVLDTEKELNFLQNFQPKTAKEKQIVKRYFETLQKAEQEINNSYFDKTSNIMKLQEIRNRLFAGKDFLTANILSLYAAKGTNLDNAFKDFKFKLINRGEFGEYVEEYDITQARRQIEYNLNIKPLKEFGTNYTEYYRDGVGAIQKLLAERQGQVAGAFHKEGLGDIDLVWGDSNFGLKHILQERTKQWGEEKALRFISHLSENIQKGHIVEVEKGRIGIKTELTTIILDKKDGNNFVITAFRDSGNKKELESLNLIQSKALTSENAGTNAKESPITSLNQDEIIPQTTQEIIKQAKASGKSVAETKELLQKHKEKDSIQDNPQVSALQTKIQQTRQQIAESKNPDKEYLHQVFKPDEIIQLEKQYFNQAMPQEYKELIQDFPSLYEQSLANKLKTYVKDTDTIQEVTTNLLNDFKDKPFKDTAKHAELLLFNTLKDKAQELGFKELDINEPSFKVAFGKFQARLKKGDIQDLSEHIAINSLRKNRLRIQEELNINPIKEFGTNYAEHYHSGESAIAKLLAERQGQVAGAFYRKELGDIDLVWGDSKMGLAHILERRTDDFIKQGLSKEEAQTKARELIGQIPEILEQSTIYRQNDSKIELITSRHTLVLGLRDDRKFIITELIDKRNKKRLGSSQTGVADTLTDETLTNKSLSSSQHLDTSTTPADPHQSGFADSNFSTSLKSEAKEENLSLNSKDDSTIKAINESIRRYKEKIKALDDPKLQKERAEKKQKIIDEFNETLHNASPTTKLDKWGTHFSILYIKPEGKKRLQKLKFDTQERIQEAIHHYTNNDRLKMELNVLWNVYNKLKEIDVEYLREKQRLEEILKGYENDLKNIGVSDLPTTKDLIKEAKEQDLSVKETKEAMQDSTQATQDLTHLKQKLENASDEEKGEIIKEAITEQNNKLLEEITKLQNVLEKKDFLPFEIDEKIKSLSTKSQ
ncbi:putative barnase/colicin E5 family endoribonuclease, partial [Helicobacter trogontum]